MQTMNIWIIRLNGQIILDYSEKDAKNTDIKENKINEENFQQKTVSLLIDHSRKLPLEVYDHQLIYLSTSSCKIYCRAKHLLLFAVVTTDNRFTINCSDSILLKLIQIYEEKCPNIIKGYKLPKRLTSYQMEEINKIKNKIPAIIQEEEHIELLRANSFKEQQATEEMIKNELYKLRIDKKQVEQNSQMIVVKYKKYMQDTSLIKLKLKVKLMIAVIFASICLTIGVIYIYNN